MEMWTWVESLQNDLRESGYERLADLIDQIPNDVSENRPERAAAALPEALAGARAIKNPWLEVFLRHWGMQNRMNNLSEGEVALSEATALLDFAHRPETRQCPQSICVTQDIAKCYGNLDGPGWAQERLEVCRETLARIDTSWPCFDCLSREYGDALLDQGQAREAITFLAQQAKAMEGAGEPAESRYQWKQAEALWRSGDRAGALKAYRHIDTLEDGMAEDDRVARHLDMACILAELGEVEEAREILPAWSDLTPGDYTTWAETAGLLARLQPDLNTWRLGARLQIALDHLIKVGAHRKALTVAREHGHAAVTRGARRTAEAALRAMEGRLPHLRHPMDAPGIVKTLAEAVETLPLAQDLPTAPEALVEHLQSLEERDPERELGWLLSAHAARPEDPDLLQVLLDAFHACENRDEAETLLWQQLDKHPQWRFLAYRLLNILLDAQNAAGIERLLLQVEPADPATACWIRARWAFVQAKWEEVGAEAERLLALEEDDDARDIWARAAMEAGDFPKALTLRQSQMERREELDRGLCWEILTAATAAEAWDTVRETATKLEMELTGESGVVEEAWERVYIAFKEEGVERRYAAQRTGPVTARILEPSAPSAPQHAQDWIVFDARPLEQAPEDEEERRTFTFTYRHVHQLEEGAFDSSWLLDGVDPGDEPYGVLRDGLWDKQWACWVVSGTDYRVQDPSGREEGLPGILVLVATPKTVPPAELHRTLGELTQGWEHPMCWRGLAERVDQDLAHHLAVEERYGL
ncbi:hypothetical protein [Holophaga foetida]|uniref:hypothetical protein n=1 Tax=Holophaga foetida TaxID=35839 RepID=UPI0002471798|nr:hypothetical protein [Holophaga foetida]